MRANIQKVQFFMRTVSAVCSLGVAQRVAGEALEQVTGIDISL